MGGGPKVNVFNFYSAMHGDITGFVLNEDCPDTDEETDEPEYDCPETKYPVPTKYAFNSEDPSEC